MKQRKDRITIKWNREVKTYLAIFLLLIFGSGMLAGGFIGESKACSDTVITTETTTQTETTIDPRTEITTGTPNVFPTKIYDDCPLSADLQDYISEKCEEYDVPMPLVMAIIEAESAFDADAISATNDYGLMQINEVNHEHFTEKYGFTNFLEPYINVFCGIEMLSELYIRYGDVDMALMAYNLGDSGAQEMWDIGIYQTAYTEQIRANMEAYEGV